MTQHDLEGVLVATEPTSEHRAAAEEIEQARRDRHANRNLAGSVQDYLERRDERKIRFETVERLIRRGVYTGPLVLNHMALGGGYAGRHPSDMLEFVRRCPDGAVLTIESLMRTVTPICTMAIALGLHVRVGAEDNFWRKKGERFTSVQQVEQMVRIARELGREVATGEEAKRIYKIGTYYNSADEALVQLGWPPNRKPGQRGFLVRTSERETRPTSRVTEPAY